ncbi:hypothetical protein K438DRAFT_1973098 [Mycena galopus ATCC 62051]|nr:hypothetical protein K438DRAFT_1973098 [Mycena galopus ATCC 62051]
MDIDEDPSAFRSTLLELPIDNIFQILKFADPADIFMFGQTCTKFLQVTATRTVWLNALRRVCEINSLFVPSFPYDEMSLSDLQRAATFGAAPRFARRLYKHETNTTPASLAPWSWRIFNPRVVKSSNVASEEPGVLKLLELVPGGRFLIIATDTLVHLWDLGYSTKLIKPHALASIALLEPNCEPAISFLPTEDGTGIEVLIMAFKDDKVNLATYHIFPLDAHPEFVLVSEPQTLGLLIRGFLAKPGLCVFHCGKEIKIWNTVQNLWAAWKVDEFPNKLFAYHDLIVGVGPRAITLWEIPTPHHDATTISNDDPHLPMMTLINPLPRQEEHEIASSSDWFCATSIKPCFLSITGWKGDTRYTARYTMHSVDCRENRNIPGSIPVLMDQSPIPGASDHLEYCTELQPCGGDVFAPWASHASAVIEANISPMPTEKKSEGPPFKTVRLFESRFDRPEDFDFSICPITGRLCTMTGEANEIVVLDFLSPGWKDGY